MYKYLILLVFYIRIGGAGKRKDLTQSQNPQQKARPPLNLPLEKGEELRAMTLSGGGAADRLLWLGQVFNPLLHLQHQ